MEVLEFIGFWLSSSWDFFTETTVPGFSFSMAALFVGLFLASLGLRLLCGMLGIGVSASDIKTVAGTGNPTKGNGR